MARLDPNRALDDGDSLVLGWGLVHALGHDRQPFFSAMVRIQAERGHAVISQGPYRFVRHPGYAGGIVYQIAVPLVLGSWWAFIPSLLAVACLILRTVLEDHTLHSELDGYQDYAQHVPYRLFPGIW